jgi:hypothetical protein
MLSIKISLISVSKPKTTTETLEVEVADLWLVDRHTEARAVAREELVGYVHVTISVLC